ncbi:MAG: hypothetical protein N2508_15760, partial [Anaerolineae bacterium]|nr:hypothetical protein [Anaerolineae bacterium]
MSRVTGQQDTRPSPDLPITELGLPTRIRNILLRAGFSSVGDVLAALNRGDETLTSLEGFGSRSLATLKACLQEHGFPLPIEAPPALDSLAIALARELHELIAMEREEVAEEQVLPPPPQPEAVSPLSRPEVTVSTYRKVFPFRYLLVGLSVVAVALILISLSLLGRLGPAGYEVLDATHSSVSHPDGVTLRVDETFTGRLRVRLSSVPRLNLLEGSAGRELRRAVEALPTHLTVKSPLYQFRARGKATQPVVIDVLVPNEAEPWETLDLYTWTGQRWEWVGGELHTEEEGREFLRTHVATLPANVVVMQTGAPAPRISTAWEAGDYAVEAAGGVVDEVNPLGLLLGLDGGFTGDPNSLLQPVAGAAYEVLPRLRNWAPDGTVNRGLLLDVLTLSEVQEAHIANLVQLCRERGYAGVELDYRGVEAQQREAYTRFVAALAEALHAEGKRLSVVVERPRPVEGGWDTGGYDWRALGAVVDALKVPFPGSPEAYEEGGEAQRLLAWAVGQVNRYKLHMLVSSLSV